MLDLSQGGCDSQAHMLRMDAAIAEALRPFLQPGGGYDWKLFGQVVLASNYFRSFHPDVRDAARCSIRDLNTQSYTYSKVRSIVRADENVQRMGVLTSDQTRQGVALRCGHRDTRSMRSPPGNR